MSGAFREGKWRKIFRVKLFDLIFRNKKNKLLKNRIDPALITYHLQKNYGDKGLAWLDSDGKENGEWSIIGIKPKK